MVKILKLSLHERIIDSNDENIASLFEVLVVDIPRDMAVGARGACGFC